MTAFARTKTTTGYLHTDAQCLVIPAKVAVAMTNLSHTSVISRLTTQSQEAFMHNICLRDRQEQQALRLFPQVNIASSATRTRQSNIRTPIPSLQTIALRVGFSTALASKDTKCRYRCDGITILTRQPFSPQKGIKKPAIREARSGISHRSLRPNEHACTCKPRCDCQVLGRQKPQHRNDMIWAVGEEHEWWEIWDVDGAAYLPTLTVIRSAKMSCMEG